MGWSASGGNYYLDCGCINVGTCYLSSEIDPAGTCVRDWGFEECGVRRKSGSTARTR